VNVDLTRAELDLIVSALEADARRWAADWAAADDDGDKLFQQIVDRHALATRLRTESQGQERGTK
jgi:hypothetical protein